MSKIGCKHIANSGYKKGYCSQCGEYIANKFCAVCHHPEPEHFLADTAIPTYCCDGCSGYKEKVMSDKETALEKAYQESYKSDRAYPYTSGFDAGWAARSEASAWVPIESGLPESDGSYPVIERKCNGTTEKVFEQLTLAWFISRKQIFVTLDGSNLVNVVAYIPTPIPPYADSGKEKGE